MPRWFQGARCLNSVRLDGKTVVITGGNTGIGKETALELSKRGARVVIACRDSDKGESAAREISSKTGNDVKTVKLDLASLRSVREAAQELLSTEPKIHILINNAGVMMCPRWETEDKFEMQLGVNHLGHFLWTRLLLERIKESAPARIINVSSVAHTRGRIHFDDIMLNKNYDATKSYCQSKLANVLFTRELAKRLEGTNVTVYSLHPGVVQTELGRHLHLSLNRPMKSAFNFFGQYFFKTPEMGAQTSIYCATEEALAKESGKYYSDCEQKRPARQALDDETSRRLWELSENLVKLNDSSETS